MVINLSVMDKVYERIASLEAGENFVSLRIEQGSLASQLAEMRDDELRGIMKKLANALRGREGFHGRLGDSLTTFLAKG